MTGMATKSCDDLAFEAVELIRKKNMAFQVQTKGQTWTCTLAAKNEQYVSSEAGNLWKLTCFLVSNFQFPAQRPAQRKDRQHQA